MSLLPAFALAFATLPDTTPTAPPKTVIRGGRLIDGAGGPPLANARIAIEGERIVLVGVDSIEHASLLDDNGIATASRWRRRSRSRHAMPRRRPPRRRPATSATSPAGSPAG